MLLLSDFTLIPSVCAPRSALLRIIATAAAASTRERRLLPDRCRLREAHIRCKRGGGFNPAQAPPLLHSYSVRLFDDDDPAALIGIHAP